MSPRVGRGPHTLALALLVGCLFGASASAAQPPAGDEVPHTDAAADPNAAPDPDAMPQSGRARRDANPLRFCRESAQCGAGWGCVGGACLSLKDPTVRQLFPIAVDRVVDRQWGKRSGPVPDKVDWLLRRFLELSGFFDVLPPQANPPGAGLEGLRQTTIDYEAWSFAGAYVVVKGELAPAEGGMLLTLRAALVEEGRLLELPHDHQLLPNTEPATVKLAVTRWVDELVTAFSGKGGVFSTRIAFSRRLKKGGSKEVGVMDMDGDALTMLTDNGSINLLPGWNRAGKVVWTSFKDNNPDLYVGGVKFSNRPRMNSGAVWSPDRKQVALTLSMDGQAEVYLLDAESGEVIRNVTRHSAIDTSPTWSPDGQRIAFVTDRFSGYPMLAVTDILGKEVAMLPQIGGYNSSPDWSPTGDEIAYSCMVGGERYQIFVINVATRQVRKLTTVGSNDEPSYSPDGRYIAFSSIRSGKQGVWIMTADGENQRPVVEEPGAYFSPAWER